MQQLLWGMRLNTWAFKERAGACVQHMVRPDQSESHRLWRPTQIWVKTNTHCSHAAVHMCARITIFFNSLYLSKVNCIALILQVFLHVSPWTRGHGRKVAMERICVWSNAKRAHRDVQSNTIVHLSRGTFTSCTLFKLFAVFLLPDFRKGRVVAQRSRLGWLEMGSECWSGFFQLWGFPSCCGIDGILTMLAARCLRQWGSHKQSLQHGWNLFRLSKTKKFWGPRDEIN